MHDGHKIQSERREKIKDFSSDCHRCIFHSHSIIVHIIWPQNCQLVLSHSMWCWKLFDLVVPACRNCIHTILFVVCIWCPMNVKIMWICSTHAWMLPWSTRLRRSCSIEFKEVFDWLTLAGLVGDAVKCFASSECTACIHQLHHVMCEGIDDWFLIFRGYDTSTLRLHPIAFHILYFSFSFRFQKVSIHKNTNFLLLFCFQVSCLKRSNVQNDDDDDVFVTSESCKR